MPGTPAHQLLPKIPPQLRTFKSDGYYHAARLPKTGAWLVWCEPVGDRLIVVFRTRFGFSGTVVAELTADHHFERFSVVRTNAVSARALRQLGLKVTRRDDEYTMASRLGIKVAETWVAKLREAQAPHGSLDGEAWLRRQLAELADGHKEG